MNKLYYSQYSCGAASFIAAHLTNFRLECETVDLSTHKTSSGVDFYNINRKGNVPSIIIPYKLGGITSQVILNENIVCLEYIADKANSSEHPKPLAPVSGSLERYEMNTLLSYLGTELHPAFGLFFNPASKDENVNKMAIGNFEKKMKFLQENILVGRTYIYGNSLTIADLYCHIILSWHKYIGIDLSAYPVAYAYYNGICELPDVKKAKEYMATNPSVTCQLRVSLVLH